MKLLQRALVALIAFGAAAAQAAYPERPITFIVPWGAGGGTDGTARYFATMFTRRPGTRTTFFTSLPASAASTNRKA